jgi:hypothetical protein
VGADTDLQYKVRACTASGDGAFSIRNTFTLASHPSMTAPPVLLFQSKNQIELEWTLTSNGGSVITGYKLYQTNVTRGGEYLVYDGAQIPTVTAVRLRELVGGRSYKYRVLALNRVGESDLSPFSQVIVAASVPARPD